VNHISRRSAIRILGVTTATVAAGRHLPAFGQTPAASKIESLAIDMVGAPDYLDPALARSTGRSFIPFSIRSRT
jgi:hypothetical protein